MVHCPSGRRERARTLSDGCPRGPRSVRQREQRSGAAGAVTARRTAAAGRPGCALAAAVVTPHRCGDRLRRSPGDLADRLHQSRAPGQLVPCRRGRDRVVAPRRRRHTCARVDLRRVHRHGGRGDRAGRDRRPGRVGWWGAGHRGDAAARPRSPAAGIAMGHVARPARAAGARPASRLAGTGPSRRAPHRHRERDLGAGDRAHPEWQDVRPGGAEPARLAGTGDRDLDEERAGGPDSGASPVAGADLRLRPHRGDRRPGWRHCELVSARRVRGARCRLDGGRVAVRRSETGWRTRRQRLGALGRVRQAAHRTAAVHGCVVRAKHPRRARLDPRFRPGGADGAACAALDRAAGAGPGPTAGHGDARTPSTSDRRRNVARSSRR